MCTGSCYPEEWSAVSAGSGIYYVYDALSTKRVYKDALPQEKCIQIIMENKGTQFDPVIADKFLEIADEFAKIREKLQD